MNTIRHIIVIPVYNDWKSLNKLLIQINKNFKNDVNFETEILINFPALVLGIVTR